MAVETKNQTQKKEDVTETEILPATALPAEKDIFLWNAPSRPFKRRSHEYWIRLIAVASIFGVILFIIEGVMPVMLLVALIFLYYVLSTVEPENIGYRFTNRGVYVGPQLFSWESFTRFWLTERFGSRLLVLEMFTLPGRLELVINSNQEKEITKVLSAYLPHEETPPTRLDKAANWLANRFETEDKK